MLFYAKTLVRIFRATILITSFIVFLLLIYYHLTAYETQVQREARLLTKETKKTSNVSWPLYKYLTPVTNISISADESIEEIKYKIEIYNKMEQIFNIEKFGKITDNTNIIVIQVHNRIMYLRYLITSLAEVKDISNSLLIFSHDFYSEEINDLIQSIDFCRVLQIFYPYSLQTHPHEFPGQDINDCVDKKDKTKICKNYRDAKDQQLKHHWWWKINQVFDNLKTTRYHPGFFLFLEEDYYVVEDILHMLNLMERKTTELCPECYILTLGRNTATLEENELNEVIAQSWNHNMGFALNRKTWLMLRKCADAFCKHNDYNWDWTLEHVAGKCTSEPLIEMNVKGTRIFHIGECGFHYRNRNCAPESTIVKVEKILNDAKIRNKLYPTDLVMKSKSVNRKIDYRSPNGNWADKRDQDLCLQMAKSND